MGKTLRFFNHYANEPETGSSLRHFYLAKHLADLGWQPIIFAASTIHQTNVNLIEDNALYRTKRIGEVQFVFVKTRNYQGNGRSRVINMVDYVRSCLKTAPLFDTPSAIIASSVHPLSWYLGRRFSKKYDAPWICEVRDLWPESLIEYGMLKRESLLTKIVRKYEYAAYKKSDAVVFTMPGGSSYVAEMGWQNDVPKEKLHWISNGIDLNRFSYEAGNFIWKDAELSDESYFRLLYCGSIGESDSLDCFLDAMKTLQNEGIRDIRLFIYGDGPRRDGLMEKCTQESIDEVYFRGRVEKKYIPSLVCRSDANILSVQRTGLLKYGCSFNKLYDYLAAGKPIISNVMPTNNDLRDADCCAAPPSPETPLANTIRSVYLQPKSERSDTGRRARLLAEDYDFRKLAGKLACILDEACNKRSKEI